MQTLFVDLPNFYSHLISYWPNDSRLLRDYFLYWLDFDRLAEALTGEPSTIWVFYSGKRFGPRENRVQDEYLDSFVRRINALRGVTARDVNIPGQQREPITLECEKCGNKNIAQWESEKGIDASLSVHLFDTMDTWDAAYLLSGDADFVPVVASLRRKGKIVIGAGFPDVSTALVRECYDYLDLWKSFLEEDFLAYKIFSPDGFAQKWLTDDVNLLQGNDSTHAVELYFEWPSSFTSIPMQRVHLLSETPLPPTAYQSINLITKGAIDLSARRQMIEEIREKHSSPLGISRITETRNENGRWSLIIHSIAWEGVKRRLKTCEKNFENCEAYFPAGSGMGYKATHRYDSEKKRFVVYSPNMNRKK